MLSEEAIETSTNLADCFMSIGMMHQHTTEDRSETPSYTENLLMAIDEGGYNGQYILQYT
ncbi:hypothetical protein STEG23_023435 [Scotinomys teguina]